ncbi:MAG: MltA domain-containing protein [Pseudomonadota bacterium]
MTHIARVPSPAPPWWLALILIAAGCAELPAPACAPCRPCAQCEAPAKPAPPRYEPSSFDAIPQWQGAQLAPGLRAFAAGCERIPVQSPLRAACDAAGAIPAGDESAARRFVEETFAPWTLAGPEGAVEGLITGYYEPVIAGSRTRTARYRHPVYGVPEDLVAVELDSLYPELRHMRLRGRVANARLVPYWSRAEIEANGALRAPVIAWVEDPVELFFLQIQGSGQIELESGERMRIGYAEQNGHPYRSLGRHLADHGEMALEQTSMQGIKAWAAANPEKLQAALNANPSYVFFRELPPPQAGAAADGPPGTLGAPLTAEYSLAVDPRHVPLGAPVFLVTTWPLSAEPLARLMAAQDTGGAIRGPARADFFWGSGTEAGALAGRMRQRGRMWILWPRGAPSPP